MGHLDLASGGKLKPQQWHTLRFTWKSAEAGAEIEVTLDGQPFAKLPVTRSALHGISYVHFQSTSANRDSGLLIESVRAEVTQP
jgi:antitoxin (DNA-binding transcriptional repressor) of toxin-antitoxin stability system